MTMTNRKEPFIWFLGDIVFFSLSLWITLFLRHFRLPNSEELVAHLFPFSILFLSWIVIFFIAGLYEKRTTFMKSVLPSTIFKVQVINSVIAVTFFYFIPIFSITPKTILFIYLLVSLVVFIFWRVYLSSFISPKNSKHEAFLIARGDEMKKLKEEINAGNYGFTIVHSINLDKVESINVQEDIIDPIYSNAINTVIIDTKDDTVLPLLPHFYNLMFSGINFFDAHETYEYIFNHVPLSLVRHGWFLENVRSKPHLMYDALKRLTDIFLSIFVGMFSLIFYPFVFLAIKIDDAGRIFYLDERIGKDNKKITIFKFRSMGIINGVKAETKIGKILRKTRIDELPQIWNVLKGDLSLIGPRPEQPKIVETYKDEIPYYNVRHLIKPGLSGWAQIYHDNHPHHRVDVEATKEKLSYDLYYIKNRSLFLDLKIALKTLRTLVSRKGK
jgi:exopolysaccharide biosynthesis polyprenyl glycosylphosphotransferase